MRPEDFLVEDPDSDPWTPHQQVLNTDLIQSVYGGTVSSPRDIEAAVALARLVHDEYKARGTDNKVRLTVSESRAAMSALRKVLQRLGINFAPPFTDFDDFCRYWKNPGASGAGGWEARRQILAGLFDPIHEQLADRQAGIVTNDLVEPASPQPSTGWTQVDEEIAELRRHFRGARTVQDYRNVGNDCVAVLERLSAVAYVPQRHLARGAEEPPVP